jgi:hypothetical protein
MTGADFLLDALLKLTGINVDDAKAHILTLGQKFFEQDALLREIAESQKIILAQQQRIFEMLQTREGEHERRNIERNVFDAGEGADANCC